MILRKYQSKLMKKEFEKLSVIERDNQLNRFSKFYYNKIKVNNEIKRF